MMDAWFEDLPVIGALSAEAAAAKLEEAGDETGLLLRSMASAQAGEQPRAFRGLPAPWPFQDKPWQYTSHVFGYIANASSQLDQSQPISHAGNIRPDLSLKNERVKITLAGMRAAGYPGSGSRRVLLDFYAQNQLRRDTEHLHFNAAFRIGHQAHAAVLGYPLFVGLTVGSEGVFFKCFTVNVANERDDALLGFLESDAFRSGLKLTQSVQPAIAPLSIMAYNLTKFIAKRRRNIPVQEFYLGLDFATKGIGARLAEGTYIAIQVSEATNALWDRDKWAFDSKNGRVVSRTTEAATIPYNYIMFTVTKHAD
jgi:hypothetical protein